MFDSVHLKQLLSALLLTRLAWFIVSIATPIFYIEINAVNSESYWINTVSRLYLQGQFEISSFVLLSCFVFPLIIQVMAFYGIAGDNLNLPFTKKISGSIEKLKVWMMSDVFFIGILISYIKLSDMAKTSPGPGAYAFGAYVLLSLCIAETYRQYRKKILSSSGKILTDFYTEGDENEDAHALEFLPARNNQQSYLSHSWALLISAILFYIPANILPMLNITILGKSSAHTILGGVLDLMHEGMWLIAWVILFASIIIPVLKFLVLIYLLLSEQFSPDTNIKTRHKLHRLVERIGKWSMVDVFVVAILVAVVNFGNLATVEPGVGATYFGIMVVLTMIASLVYKPSFGGVQK